MYKITYPKLLKEIDERGKTSEDVYSIHRKKLPPFTWVSSFWIAMPNEPNVWPAWPFYANSIFDQMGVQEEVEKNEDCTNLLIAKDSNENPLAMEWE